MTRAQKIGLLRKIESGEVSAGQLQEKPLFIYVDKGEGAVPRYSYTQGGKAISEQEYKRLTSGPEMVLTLEL